MANDDRVTVVTGAAGNIGVALSRALAKTGGTVVMVVRDPAQAEATRAEVAKASGNPRVETLGCDLGSRASVGAAAAELMKRHPTIHVLVNNAAAFSSSRRTTTDGHELQMGTNHLGHFLFTLLLEPALFAAKDARVVVMGMPAKNPILLDDLMLERRYDGMTAYGMSKAANLSFARELAQRWKGKVTVNAAHPGMTRTTLISEAPLPIRIVFALFASPPERGAETPVYVATSPELSGVTGRFFIKKKDTPFPPGTEDQAERQKLWALSERLVGLSPRA